MPSTSASCRAPRQAARHARAAAPARHGRTAVTDHQGLQGGQQPGHALAEGRRPALTWTRLGGRRARWHAQSTRCRSAKAVSAGAAPAYCDAKGDVCSSTSRAPRRRSRPVSCTGSPARAGDRRATRRAPRACPTRRTPPEWIAMMVEEEVRRQGKGLRAQARAREPRARRRGRGRPAWARSTRLRALARPGAHRGQGRGRRRRRRTAKALIRVRLMIANPGGRTSPELGLRAGSGELRGLYAREFKK